MHEKNTASEAHNSSEGARYKLDSEGPARLKPDGRGRRVSDCGDEIEFFIKLKDWVIEDIAFNSYGCSNTVASARVAQVLAKGKTLKDALVDAAPVKIAEVIRLGADHLHAAEMVYEALTEAINQAIEVARDPWKRAYGR